MKNRHMSKKIDIISCFLDDYKKILTGRELSRLTKLNHQTIFNYLDSEKEIFKYKKVGRNNEYYLNFDNPKTILNIEIAEKQKALDLLENKEINILLKDLNGFFETLIIYESFAKKEQNKDSDIDLLFLGKTTDFKNIIKRFPREINYEILNFTEFEKKINTPLATEIKRKHVIFGEATKVVKLFSA